MIPKVCMVHIYYKHSLNFILKVQYYIFNRKLFTQSNFKLKKAEIP